MTQEEIKIYNENSKKELEMSDREISLGLIVPFFLFWGGILTPFVTDSLLVWILSLLPFYGFIIICNNVFRGRVEENTFIGSNLLCSISSVFLSILLFFVPENMECLINSCRLGFVNVIPSMLILFLGLSDNFVISLKGCPIFPFFFIGNSNS